MSSSEIDEPKDPHLCSFCRIPQNPPDGGIPQKYLEKSQKNSEFENSEFERERERERGRERERKRKITAVNFLSSFDICKSKTSLLREYLHET